MKSMKCHKLISDLECGEPAKASIQARRTSHEIQEYYFDCGGGHRTRVTRQVLLGITDWHELKDFYDLLSISHSGEPVEEYGARVHHIVPIDDARPRRNCLGNLEKFWQYHVAPATNRPDAIGLSENIKPVIALIVMLNYEVYCNIVDALDEFGEVEEDRNKELEEQRMLPHMHTRHWLNVLRFAGDAVMLFEGLRSAIASDEPKEINLANQLAVEIRFRDGRSGFWHERKKLKTYRNMLVHLERAPEIRTVC
jgi:hypothetical protein